MNAKTDGKIVIIINGSGGVGKDALCSYAQKEFPSTVISSITPIKDIAILGGWDGDKDEKGRLLLVELKQAFVEYNDLPLNYLMEEYHKFLSSDKIFLFVHIREPEEIEKFKAKVTCLCRTMLITRDSCPEWHNTSDSGVSDYRYDHYFNNNKEFSESCRDFTGLLSSIQKETE